MQDDRFLASATREQRETLKRDLEPVVSSTTNSNPPPCTSSSSSSASRLVIGHRNSAASRTAPTLAASRTTRHEHLASRKPPDAIRELSTHFREAEDSADEDGKFSLGFRVTFDRSHSPTKLKVTCRVTKTTTDEIEATVDDPAQPKLPGGL